MKKEVIKTRDDKFIGFGILISIALAFAYPYIVGFIPFPYTLILIVSFILVGAVIVGIGYMRDSKVLLIIGTVLLCLAICHLSGIIAVRVIAGISVT